MMRHLLATAALVLGVAAPAQAEDDTQGGSGDNSIWVDKVERSEASNATLGKQDTSERPNAAQPQITLGNTACEGAEQFIEAGAPAAVSFCPPSASPQPVLTTDLIRRAFAELKLPAGRLVIQPPDGLTLVNFDTNFYTTNTDPIARTVTLLGQRVTLEATPATYHWDFGDGRELSTSEPGAPYPRLDVTHSYLRTGTYRPSLSTTYTGRYRVGGGAWQQIPGTVTIDGAGQPLRAIEAQPKLVGY